MARRAWARAPCFERALSTPCDGWPATRRHPLRQLERRSRVDSDRSGRGRRRREPNGTFADTLETVSAQLGGESSSSSTDSRSTSSTTRRGPGRDAFFEEFPEAVPASGVRASFLARATRGRARETRRFKARIPALFGNYLRLEHLDRSAAREAIVRPVGRYNELSSSAGRSRSSRHSSKLFSTR